jgi:hypothetical protein
MDWKNELSSIMECKTRVTRAEQENAVFEEFLDKIAVPGLNEIADEFCKKHNRDAQVRRAPASVTLSVRSNDTEEISFRVMKHYVQNGILPRAEVRVNRGQRHTKYESMFRADPQNYTILAVTKEDVITTFIKYYRIGLDSGV